MRGPNKTVDKVLAAYNKSPEAPLKKLAEKVGLTHQHVSDILRKNGVKRAEERAAKVKADRAAAKKMRKSGMSYDAIGRELDCSKTAARMLCEGTWR